MKNVQSQVPQQHPKTNDHKSRPDVRDNLDSRGGEEQSGKGKNATHNKREDKSKEAGRQ